MGEGIDPLTGVNLETVKLTSNQTNGKLFWQILELYNNITKQTYKETNIYNIDLANVLPKDSRYFYDVLHYTNEGAEKVAEIIHGELKNHFDLKYKDFIKH